MTGQRKGRRSPTYSIRLKDCIAHGPSVLPYYLPLGGINTVAQVRDTIAGAALEELAESVRLQGQQSPAAVAAVSPAEIKNYLDVINELWSTHHTAADLRSTMIDGKPFYLIVIYGHRRLAALRLLEKERRRQRRGNGSSQRTPRIQYLATVRFGLTVTEVIRMQLAENMYVPPPKHREVEALSRMWRFESREHAKQGKKLTLKAFARMMGRKPDFIRNLLEFTTLPQALQDRIDPAKGYSAMSYGLLLQVARYVKALRRHGRRISEEELILLADSLVLRGVTVKQYAKEVDARIRELEGGQAELFASDTFGVTKQQNRQVAAGGLTRTMMSAMAYWRIVMVYQQQGAFDKAPLGTATHAPQGPAMMAVRLLAMLGQTVPPLQGLIAEQERRRVSALPPAMAELPSLSHNFNLLAAGEDSGRIEDANQDGFL